jgi:hypothetical protein
LELLVHQTVDVARFPSRVEESLPALQRVPACDQAREAEGQPHELSILVGTQHDSIVYAAEDVRRR